MSKRFTPVKGVQKKKKKKNRKGGTCFNPKIFVHHNKFLCRTQRTELTSHRELTRLKAPKKRIVVYRHPSLSHWTSGATTFPYRVEVDWT